MIGDHKDILKLTSQVSTIISSLKSECAVVLTKVSIAGDFTEIWEKDADAKLKGFMEQNPSLAEYQEQILYYHVMVLLKSLLYLH